MRHAQAGDKLGVLPDHRRALIRNLTLALIEHEKIRTTPRRAKAIRWYAEHIVTLAKRGDLASRRQIIQLLGSTETAVPGQNRIRLALERVYTNLVPRFRNRNGGYTQIFRLAQRRAGDAAEMCIMQYLPAPEEKKAGKTSDKKGNKGDSKVEAKKAQDKPVKKEAKATQETAPKKAEKSAKAEEKPSDKKASKKKEK